MRALIYAILLAALALPALAEEAYAPDDTVYLDLSTEGYVTTKTAKVTATVDAAATDAQSGDLRESMQKAIAGVAKDGGPGSEWRLTNVNRNQDDSGLTRWQATYEARLSEGALSGLSERAQKLSKPGMQIRIANIDFTPTLAETEARRAELRADLYKRANEELARLNATLPGRNYRIAGISFGGVLPAPVAMPAAPMMMMKAARMQTDAMVADSGAGEVSAHLQLTARVSYAARPDASGAAKVNAPAK